MTVHVLLLVGTNPLPVFVGAMELVERLTPERVTLFHTGRAPGEGTYDDAAQVKALLTKRHATLAVDLRTVGANDRAGTEKALGSLCGAYKGGDKVHLHYTGGTKAMVVDAVLALTNLAGKKGFAYSDSYLDSRADGGHTLCAQGETIVPRDLRKHVAVSLEELAELHRFAVAPFWVPGPAGLSEVSAPGDATNIAGNPVKQERQVFRACTDALAGRPPWTLRHGVHASPWRLRDRSPRTQPAYKKDFELDVVAVLGYQLVLLSCSTKPDAEGDYDERGRFQAGIKHKAFEALHRARQIAGDEARVVVVTGMKPAVAQKVEDELHDEIGTRDRPVVLIEDMGTTALTERLKAYFDGLGWKL